MTTPLIWTTKGNLPIASLKHETEWRYDATQIIFIERYTLDGETVKESSHVCVLTGVSLMGEASA